MRSQGSSWYAVGGRQQADLVRRDESATVLLRERDRTLKTGDRRRNGDGERCQTTSGSWPSAATR